ncbi:MAG: hypothetical protein U0R50_09170 [Gaiellales bacterium]
MKRADALELLRFDRPFVGVPGSTTVAAVGLRPEGPLARVATAVMLSRTKHGVQRTTKRRMPDVCLVAFGDLIEFGGSRAGFAELHIGPVLRVESDARSRRWVPDPMTPVTGSLIRFVSAERLVSDAIEQLRAGDHWLKVAERLNRLSEPMTAVQRRAYRRLHEVKPPGAKLTDEEVELVARRYVQLVSRGVLKPLPILAAELGITRDQARDRVRRAREAGYLAAARPGRPSAELGPRLSPSVQ